MDGKLRTYPSCHSSFFCYYYNSNLKYIGGTYPKKICQSIERILCDFIWGHDHQSKKALLLIGTQFVNPRNLEALVLRN